MCGTLQQEVYLHFCPCPKTLCEAEFKDGGLIDLEEEILGQTKIEAVSWILLDCIT